VVATKNPRRIAGRSGQGGGKGAQSPDESN